MADLLFPLIDPQIRERKFQQREIDLDELTDEELHSRYRFGRESIKFLVEILKDDRQRQTRRNHALSPTLQVLVALRFSASGSFLQIIGDTIGLPKSTVSRIVTDVSKALVNKQEEFINFPTEPAEVQEVKRGFYEKGGFPGVVGCIDGTHVRIRYEFAKSRGQIHWHQLSWREDRQPHQLLHEAREDGCEEEEYAARLSQWADETFAMTALHPAGNDEEGQPRKDLWPPPEGTAEPISDDRDPLVKMLMQIATTQDAILEDHLFLVNRVGLHSCSASLLVLFLVITKFFFGC